MQRTFCSLLALVSVAVGQLVGTNTAEVHPSMKWQQCTASGSCTTKDGKLVIDSNWRWLHDKSGSTNCYTGNTWNSQLAPDNTQCAANCVLEGADYVSTYGTIASGDSLQLKFVTKGPYATNIGSRMYMMENDDTYQLYHLLNQEFSFDVDLSNLPCGLNGALYFVAMDKDGGKAKYPTNKAGAKYGTGYCDAQCARDLKFINGQCNVEGWKPSSSDPNSGVGGHGSCCVEMDIWEANSISTAFTPHSCDTPGQTRCNGDACGGTYSSTRYAGTCDPDGCDFNSWRQGNKSFYGKGMTVDTSKKFTVVTQFITSTGTASGTLSEIKRFYIQNGKVIPNSESTVKGVTGNSINQAYCDAQKSVFGDTNSYKKHGGFASISAGMKQGMVLVMSLWDDHYANMLWLDSDYPLDKDSAAPGISRGSCSRSSGAPKDVEGKYPGASVTYSNIKTGPIGSTYKTTQAKLCARE